MGTPLLTATPGAPPTYNPSMAETFSWIPVEGAGRPLFAQATYIANPEDISVSLSAENLNVNLGDVENLVRTISQNVSATNPSLTSVDTKLTTISQNILDIENLVNNNLPSTRDFIVGYIPTISDIYNRVNDFYTSIFSSNQLGGYGIGFHLRNYYTSLTSIDTTLKNGLNVSGGGGGGVVSDAPVQKLASSALVNTFTVPPSVARIYNIFGISTANVGQYIQIYDIPGSTPTGTPAGTFFVPANSNFNFEFVKGIPFTNNRALIANSLTPIDYNAGNSDLFITVIYN